MKIKVLHHASIKLEGNKIIYIDPYQITEPLHDADYIFITHDHYDHYDEESINNLQNNKTKIIVPKCLNNKIHDLIVEPIQEYLIDDIKFKTIPSYNINKVFHPKEKEYVGYNILLEGKYYYIMGDTDVTIEAKNVDCDVCFVPVGGTYTMNLDEAVTFINELKPKKAIPIHYGLIVGDNGLGIKFKEKINKEIEVEL